MKPALVVYHSDSLLDVFKRIRKTIPTTHAEEIIESIQDRIDGDGGNKIELLSDFFTVEYTVG